MYRRKYLFLIRTSAHSKSAHQYPHFKYIEPHVKPPPKAAKIRLSPFLNLLSHSHKHSGMVPLVVLPYRSMFTITLSALTPVRFAVASMMRLLAWCGTSQAISSEFRLL